jgi:hypothetical protein
VLIFLVPGALCVLVRYFYCAVFLVPGAEQFWIPSGAVLEGDKDCPPGGRGRTEVPTGAVPPHPPIESKRRQKAKKTVSRDEFFL